MLIFSSMVPKIRVGGIFQSFFLQFYLPISWNDTLLSCNLRTRWHWRLNYCSYSRWFHGFIYLSRRKNCSFRSRWLHYLFYSSRSSWNLLVSLNIWMLSFPLFWRPISNSNHLRFKLKINLLICFLSSNWFPFLPLENNKFLIHIFWINRGHGFSFHF